MRKLLIEVIILSLIVSLGFTSCNSDVDSSTTNDGSNHCAITYMLLGTLYRNMHTESSTGEDSIFTTTISGSKYMLYIDQYKGEIYNPDSLPVGTRPDKVVFSSVAYDGILAYRLDSGLDTLYTTGDTIDFTNPRVFVCYSYSGKAKKSYNVHINVHQVNTEEFSWGQVSNSNENIKPITSQRAFYKDNQIYIFAIADNAPVLFTTSTSDGTNWAKTTLSLTEFSPEKVQLFGGKFYTFENNVLLTSSDGIIWTNENTTFTADALMAVSSKLIFAKKGDKVYFSKDAINWEEDEVEGYEEKLPSSGFTSAWTTMTFNPNFEYVVCGGENADGNVEWKKIVDNYGDNTEAWSLYDFGEDKTYPYPSFPGTQILSYDSKLFALGLEGDTLSLFHVSIDSGRTWRPQRDAYQHPRSMAATNFSWTIDDDKYIWIICGGSGNVWRGRINRLGFQTNQTTFTE